MGFTPDQIAEAAPSVTIQFWIQLFDAYAQGGLCLTTERRRSKNGRVTWESALAVLRRPASKLIRFQRNLRKMRRRDRRSIDLRLRHHFSPAAAMDQSTTPIQVRGLPAELSSASGHWRRPGDDWGFHQVVAPAKASLDSAGAAAPRPREIFGSSRKSQHPLIRLVHRSRRRRHCSTNFTPGTKTAHGNGGLIYAKAWHLWFSHPMTRFVAEPPLAIAADP